MADPQAPKKTAEPRVPETPPPPAEVPRRRSVWKIVIIMAALMLIEGLCLVALMPAVGSAGSQDEVEKVEKEGHQIDQQQAQNVPVEIKIGEFQVTNNVAYPDTAMQMVFQVHVTVLAKAADEVTRRLADRQFRVRQAIEIVARQASYADVKDPRLDLIKRQIQKNVNEILGGEYITEVIVSGFRDMEQ